MHIFCIICQCIIFTYVDEILKSLRKDCFGLLFPTSLIRIYQLLWWVDSLWATCFENVIIKAILIQTGCQDRDYSFAKTLMQSYVSLSWQSVRKENTRYLIHTLVVLTIDVAFGFMTTIRLWRTLILGIVFLYFGKLIWLPITTKDNNNSCCWNNGNQ